MKPLKRFAAVTVLVLGACSGASQTTATPDAPPPPAAAASPDFKAITAKALSKVERPAAAIVLSVRERQLLGVAEVNGGATTRPAHAPK